MGRIAQMSLDSARLITSIPFQSAPQVTSCVAKHSQHHRVNVKVKYVRH